MMSSLARSTVKEYERRAERASLSWPLPDVDDAALESVLFPPPPYCDRRTRGQCRTGDDVDRELRKNKRVTRQLLWEEYRSMNPEGYSYTRYCELFHEWRGRQDISMLRVLVVGSAARVTARGVSAHIGATVFPPECTRNPDEHHVRRS